MQKTAIKFKNLGVEKKGVPLKTNLGQVFFENEDHSQNFLSNYFLMNYTL